MSWYIATLHIERAALYVWRFVPCVPTFLFWRFCFELTVKAQAATFGRKCRVEWH